MLFVMDSGEAAYCSNTVQALRLEIHELNSIISQIDRRLTEGYHPPFESELEFLLHSQGKALKRRAFAAKLIKELREVLVHPPSLETRIIGFINRVLSFRVI